MTQQELKHILSSKFDFENWKDLLGTMFLKIDYLSKPIQIVANLVKSGGQVGNIRLDDGRSLGLFKFEVADSIQIARNRKGLRDIAIKYVDQDVIHGALVFYYSEDQADYRLTFVSKQTSLNEDGAFATKETAPKRYTFLLGTNEPCTTAANRLLELINKKKSGSVHLADVTEAFSVERLNKDFFNGYKERYVKFLNHINDDTKENRDYVKKLLGRLVFLQFLQKKGWMGVPANQQGWNGGDKFYLNHLIESYEGNDRLLSDVLEPLFFNTLNERRDNDLADSRLGENIKIPYLNGGLFDKDDLDKKDIDFPYDYFKELMDFFAMYNFTIDENDPEDSEIGIDPEMLGHIFENLLEDNKDKGAFYTPKEIVQYMSQESVVQYLKSHAPEELHTAIDSLIKLRVVEPILQNKENARLVNKALSVVKVCDPAIGSGAFPMGVLNVLFDCRHLLYGFIGKNEDFSYAKVKRDIIQNNIYGVDIEKGAVDIARLRFWLALVVDENEPQPLPNLDYKIMCGDSLLHRFALDAPFQNILRDYNQKNHTNYTLEDYRQWVYDYTDISDHTKKDDFRQRIEDIKRAVKTELSDKEKGKIAKVRGAIDNLQMEDMFGGKKNEKKIKALQKELKVLEQQRAEIESNKIFDQAFEWRFEFPALLDEEGNFAGFDIVIGNPPYISHDNIPNNIPCRKFNSFEPFADIYCYFYEVGIKILASNGILTFITSNSFLRANYGLPLRQYIRKHCNILQLIDIEGTQVFGSAIVNTVISSLVKSKSNNLAIIVNAEWNKCSLDDFIKSNMFMYQQNDFEMQPWTLVNPQNLCIRRKIEKAGTSLEGLHTKIRLGLATGDNNAFVINETQRQNFLLQDIKNEKIIKPVIRGQDIRRYWHSAPQYLLLTKNNIDVQKDYPNIYEYLDSFGEKFKNRGAKGRHWSNLRACSFFDDFKKEKIIWIELTDTGRFSLSCKEEYLLNSAYFLIPPISINAKFLLGILNSAIIRFYIKQVAATSGMGTLRWINNYIKLVTIPSATIGQQQSIISLVDQILAAKKANPQADTSAWEQEIDYLAYHLYSLTYDEVLIVEPEIPITKEEYNNNN